MPFEGDKLLNGALAAEMELERREARIPRHELGRALPVALPVRGEPTAALP